MVSPPKGWKGSHGLEGSAAPDMLTGVLLPEDIKKSAQSRVFPTGYYIIHYHIQYSLMGVCHLTKKFDK